MVKKGKSTCTCQLCGQTYESDKANSHVGVVLLHYLDWKDVYAFHMREACMNYDLHDGSMVVREACNKDRFYDRDLLQAVRAVMAVLKKDSARNRIILQYGSSNREWALKFARTLRNLGFKTTTQQKVKKT